MIGAYNGRRTATVMPITKGTPTRSALPSTCNSQLRSQRDASINTSASSRHAAAQLPSRPGTVSKSKQAHDLLTLHFGTSAFAQMFELEGSVDLRELHMTVPCFFVVHRSC